MKYLIDPVSGVIRPTKFHRADDMALSEPTIMITGMAVAVRGDKLVLYTDQAAVTLEITPDDAQELLELPGSMGWSTSVFLPWWTVAATVGLAVTYLAVFA